MSMTDPIADLLTRIRNALSAGYPSVEIPASKLKEAMCNVLLSEGFITGFERREDGKQGILTVALKYSGDHTPVITGIRRVSRPSLRIYSGADDIKPVRSGLGISIVTTSQGVMTGKKARR
ncbi:MAG: 30S ribosomal protein S8, partial [Candidatus Hydrogenedentes bacterium]|nr:30S ribosomal protein S8 [Candidatus Hydrogenedentota bacterium]